MGRFKAKGGARVTLAATLTIGMNHMRMTIHKPALLRQYTRPMHTTIMVTTTTITITITCGSCLDRKRRRRRHYSPVPGPNCHNFSIAHRAATYTSQVPNKTRPMK
jgi:hypothetical protein